MIVQARKTYVSLVTPRRTFARIQPTTMQRVDLGLRLAGMEPGERLTPSKIHETMPLQISLTSLDEIRSDFPAGDAIRRSGCRNGAVPQMGRNSCYSTSRMRQSAQQFR